MAPASVTRYGRNWLAPAIPDMEDCVRYVVRGKRFVRRVEPTGRYLPKKLNPSGPISQFCELRHTTRDGLSAILHTSSLQAVDRISCSKLERGREMFSDPRDDWYDWRTAHPRGADATAGWIIAGVIVALFLLIPLV